ncbi:hypothetical protein FOZ61_002341 [Perkinsus olseni]|uniref:DUF4470 domain-containing protein n=1 Tax=Perkinsus olseni TaxID=32597 RepID=A0A7J6MBL9_PEROL|nr:hypothetical protein FOZ61_002341 [Perkinsus olseni]KAF4668968.1 hypothetical protein FOL46_001741 [Perkinsus olseni]
MASEVDVRLTCPPLCPLVARWFTLYPFANIPPRDLCASARGCQLPTRVLLLGCGDMVSVGHTFLLNQTCTQAKSWASTPLQAVCCDTEPAIIARDLVYLQLLINTFAAEHEEGSCLPPKEALVAWEAVYGMFITEEVADELKVAIRDVFEGLQGGPSVSALGQHGVHLAGDRKAVIELLHWWYELLNDRVCAGQEDRDTARICYHHLWSSLPARESLDEAVQEYRDRGYAGVSNVGQGAAAALSPLGNSKRTVVNPTFLGDVVDFTAACSRSFEEASAQDIAKVWRVDFTSCPYYAIPGELWKVYDDAGPCRTRFVDRGGERRSLSPTETCFEMFSMRSEALVKALMTGKNMIILHCGDAFQLCDALAPQPRAWSMGKVDSVRSLMTQLKDIGAPTCFDMIDTSNIADNTGALPILLSAAPLLASREDNPRAVLATDVMNAGCSSYGEILSNCLAGVPLWLIPYTVGLQLDGLRSYDSRDSRIRSDPSRAWTAYPRSFVASASANASGMAGLCVRWRRCYDNFDEVSIGDSPQIVNAIHSVLERAAAPGGRAYPVGVTTVVRLLEALFNSGALTQSWKKDWQLLVSAEATAANLHPSMISRYCQGYRALTCLAGLTEYKEILGEDGRLVEAVLEVSSEWRDQDGVLGEIGRNRMDYRFVDVVFSSAEGENSIFVGCMYDERVRVVVPQTVLDMKYVSVDVTAAQIVEDIICLPATVVSSEVVPSAFYTSPPRLPASSPSPSLTSFKLVTRDWLRSGAVRFIIRLTRESSLEALRRGAEVKCRLRDGHLNVLDITADDVCIASAVMSAEVSLNDVHLKVARKSGSVDAIIPVKSCCPLGATTAAAALPRSVSGCSSSASLNPCPQLPVKTLRSLASMQWAALSLEVPMLPQGVSSVGSKGMNQMRMTLREVFKDCLACRSEGRSWGGRGIVTVGEENSIDVIVFLSKDVNFDWTYGNTISAAACVLNPSSSDEVLREVSAVLAKTGLLHYRVDENSEEPRHWTEEYIPAAATLAILSMGKVNEVITSTRTSMGAIGVQVDESIRSRYHSMVAPSLVVKANEVDQ